MTHPENTSLIINGWRIGAHPLFFDQLELLIDQVKYYKRKDPEGFSKKNVTKRLAAISKLTFEIIPQNPGNDIYRQGNTLGMENRHWFRAKFFQQYRLFFRFNKENKIILYVWINDENNKRAYGSDNDAYKVFCKMLKNKNPPNDWKALLEACQQNRRILSARDSILSMV